MFCDKLRQYLDVCSKSLVLLEQYLVTITHVGPRFKREIAATCVICIQYFLDFRIE